jgi:crotonobetainyl-CoA:carnitine CoA-transferase CaiB-like acyl-CoA transferase
MSDTVASSSLPLAGIRVLDATSNIAGPFGGAILADLGADVIKIETPSGDPSRSMVPIDGDRSAYFHIVNRNKSAESIDLKSHLGKSLLAELMNNADVFLTNFLPDRLAALDLQPAELMKKFPRLIVGNLSSYGSTGPDASIPGYDGTIQARTGIMHVTGEAEGDPVRAGVSVLDVGGGMWLAIGILAAIVERNKSGKGTLVETSLFETGATWVSYHLSAEQLSGLPSVRSGSGHPTFSPYGIFATGEGVICIGVGSDNIFEKLCTSINRADLISDPRFKMKEEVDQEMYRYYKAINVEVAKLKSLLSLVSSWENELKKLQEKFSKKPKQARSLKNVHELMDEIKQLKLAGKDNPGDRQVGAWQSIRTTPVSAINEAEKVAMARLDVPSEQDWKRVSDAAALIDAYRIQINQFYDSKWRKLKKE